MQKRFKYSKILLIVATAGCLLSVASCNKANKEYYNYENKLSTFNGNTLQYLQSQPGVYDSMLLAINRVSGLADTISKADLTVFAINNRSFSLAIDNINQARKDSFPEMAPVSLSTLDSAVLDTFLCRYLIKGQQTSESLVNYTDGLLFPSVRYDYNMQMQFTSTNASGFEDGGPKSIIFSDPKNSIFTKNWVRTNTITVDIKTTNGIVHVLSPSHDFGFGNSFIKSVNYR